MSNPVDGDATPISSLRQLAEHIAEGCKPRDHFGIGTEHEKFGFRLQDLKSPPYEPSDGQPGSIRDLLHGLEAFGATPILDHGNTIAAFLPRPSPNQGESQTLGSTASSSTLASLKR